MRNKGGKKEGEYQGGGLHDECFFLFRIDVSESRFYLKG